MEQFPQLGRVNGKAFPDSSQVGKGFRKPSWGPDGKTGASSSPNAWARPYLPRERLGLEGNENGGRVGAQNGNALFPKARTGDDDSEGNGSVANGEDNDDCDEEDDVLFDSDDDAEDLLDDSGWEDVTSGEDTHESLKNSNWFKAFFDALDEMTAEEIRSPGKQWHCPACKGGAGAIDWYRGLDPIMVHAMTIKTRRAKLHRTFAKLLDAEMRRRGVLVIKAGEAFGKWKGLNETVKDREIVWPPMVVIMNTRYEREENGKWIGMGNQELLHCFKSYAALKSTHSYGPQGHRGMGVLVFESSAAGYLEAARLHKHFKDQGRDRNAWYSNRVPFGPGGMRNLYGFLAEKDDMENFNLHCQEKLRLKYETRSYQEMVESQIRHINEDSQQLVQMKNRAVIERRQSEALAQALSKMGEKLRKTTEESRIVIQQTRLMHEQKQEEMDSLEQFFKEQIRLIHAAICAKEDNFQKFNQAKGDREKHSSAITSTMDNGHRVDDIAELQQREMEAFGVERLKLMTSYDEKKAVITRRYWEQLLELERELENELTLLVEKYTPPITNRPPALNKKKYIYGGTAVTHEQDHIVI